MKLTKHHFYDILKSSLREDDNLPFKKDTIGLIIYVEKGKEEVHYVLDGLETEFLLQNIRRSSKETRQKRSFWHRKKFTVAPIRRLMMVDIFISYAREDQQFVELIKPVLRRLQVEGDIKFFQDLENISPGEQYAPQIREALEESSIIICLLSMHYFSSAFIRTHEMPFIEHCFDVGVQVIPILIEPVSIGADDFFSRVQWVNTTEKPLCDIVKVDKDRSIFVVNFEQCLRKALKRIPLLPPRSSKVRYNLVVVGKAGVGKSELINYFFGKDIQKTGIGKPVTKIGFHRQDLNIAGIPASIWDSAGLEVGNHEEWINALREELTDRGPTQPVQRWFHTVLYCVQAPGSRIEPFEIDIINHFLNERYKVIIVLTKAFISKRKRDELAESIQQEISKPLSCVHVNSKDEEVMETVAPHFGRKELTKEIESALIDSLMERVPARCIGFMEKYIDSKCKKLIKYVDDMIGTQSKDNISDYTTEELKDLLDDVKSPQGQFQQIIKREIKHTLGVYKEIAGIVDWVIESTEDKSIVGGISSQVEAPRVGTFLGHVGDVINSLYEEWDLSDSLGEDVNEVVEIIVAPFAMILGIVGGLVEFINSHRGYKERIHAKINNCNIDIKKELWKNEDNIKRFFSERVRQLRS